MSPLARKLYLVFERKYIRETAPFKRQVIQRKSPYLKLSRWRNPQLQVGENYIDSSNCQVLKFTHFRLCIATAIHNLLKNYSLFIVEFESKHTNVGIWDPKIRFTFKMCLTLCPPVPNLSGFSPNYYHIQDRLLNILKR